MNDNNRINDDLRNPEINQDRDLEPGLPREHLEKAVTLRISRLGRAASWLLKKFRELFYIGLVGIPVGQLFLESQSVKQHGGVSGDWFNSASPIAWLVWVCIGVILALDNFDYLQENKERIIGAILGFSAVPTVDRLTVSKFSDNVAVYPICLVLAIICPKVFQSWTASTSQHERQN